MKKCPFCGSKMVGEVGSRVCNNLNCKAYEVDTTDPQNYRKKMTKQQYEERKKK